MSERERIAIVPAGLLVTVERSACFTRLRDCAERTSKAVRLSWATTALHPQPSYQDKA